MEEIGDAGLADHCLQGERAGEADRAAGVDGLAAPFYGGLSEIETIGVGGSGGGDGDILDGIGAEIGCVEAEGGGGFLYGSAEVQIQFDAARDGEFAVGLGGDVGGGYGELAGELLARIDVDGAGGFDAAEGGAIDVDQGVAGCIALHTEVARDRIDVLGGSAGAGQSDGRGGAGFRDFQAFPLGVDGAAGGAVESGDEAGERDPLDRALEGAGAGGGEGDAAIAIEVAEGGGDV